MKNVLVVLDLVPEETQFYIIRMEEDECKYYSKADNYVVNADEYEEEKSYIVNLFINAVCNNPEYEQYCEDDCNKQMFGKWSSCKVDSIKDLSNVDQGISLGFYM